jgi:hypothetical protein
MHEDTEKSISAGRRTRREFLQHGAAIALAGKYLASHAASPVFAAERVAPGAPAIALGWIATSRGSGDFARQLQTPRDR